MDLDELKKILRNYLPDATTEINGFLYVVFKDSSCIAFRANGEVTWTQSKSIEGGCIAERCVSDGSQRHSKKKSNNYKNLKEFVVEFISEAQQILQEQDV